MGVEFRWQAGDVKDVLPEPEPAPRPWLGVGGRWLLGTLVALVVLGGLVAWRAKSGERAARQDLQRVVEQEVAALKAGQLEVLTSLLTGTPLYWRRYHEANFSRESAWYATRGTASVRVERVRLEPGRAEAVIVLDDSQQTRRGTWYYVRVGEYWRHGPPPVDSWGETKTVEAPHVSVRAAGLDLDLVEDLAGELEALYAGLLGAYGISPNPSVPSCVSVEVTPIVAGTEWRTSVRSNGELVLNVQIPSPWLALELWTVEEQMAYLGRAARIAVTQQLVYDAMWDPREPPWVVVHGLILWHAEAWEPEWDHYLQTSLADGMAERFLSILDGDAEAERFLQDLMASLGNPEEAIQRLLPLTYVFGELLGTRYSGEELASFLRHAGRHDTIWGAFEAELGLSRAELEEAWRAHLRQRE